jgi:hypothetical protein
LQAPAKKNSGKSKTLSRTQEASFLALNCVGKEESEWNKTLMTAPSAQENSINVMSLPILSTNKYIQLTEIPRASVVTVNYRNVGEATKGLVKVCVW